MHITTGSCDGVNVSKNPERSLVPVVLQVLNLPPWIRHKFDKSWLIAVFPEVPKDKYAVLWEPILEELDALWAGLVTDVITDVNRPHELHKRVCRAALALWWHDTRGIAAVN